MPRPKIDYDADFAEPEEISDEGFVEMAKQMGISPIAVTDPYSREIYPHLNRDPLVKFHVMMPPTLRDQVKAIAKEIGVPVAVIVRRALFDFIKRYNAKKYELGNTSQSTPQGDSSSS